MNNENLQKVATEFLKGLGPVKDKLESLGFETTQFEIRDDYSNVPGVVFTTEMEFGHSFSIHGGFEMVIKEGYYYWAMRINTPSFNGPACKVMAVMTALLEAKAFLDIFEVRFGAQQFPVNLEGES